MGGIYLASRPLEKDRDVQGQWALQWEPTYRAAPAPSESDRSTPSRRPAALLNKAVSCARAGMSSGSHFLLSVIMMSCNRLALCHGSQHPDLRGLPHARRGNAEVTQV